MKQIKNKKRNIAFCVALLGLGVTAVAAPVVVSCGKSNGGGTGGPVIELELDQYEFTVDDVKEHEGHLITNLDEHQDWAVVIVSQINIPYTLYSFSVLSKQPILPGISAMCLSNEMSDPTQGELVISYYNEWHEVPSDEDLIGSYHLIGYAITAEEFNYATNLLEAEVLPDWNYVIKGDNVSVDIEITANP